MDTQLHPHNTEAESATLGAILVDPDVLDEVIPLLRPDDFYHRANAILYENILLLRQNETEIDIITLSNQLESINKLPSIGGTAHISLITSKVPSSANVRYYAKIVRENSLRRQIIQDALKGIEEARNSEIDFNDLLESVEKRVFSVAENQRTARFFPVRDIVNDVVTLIERRYENKSHYTGVPSGFAELDDMLSGFQDSEFIVLGARPSVGKTSLALTFGAHIAIDQNIPTGFFTLEMSSMALIQRLISSEAQIPAQDLRKGMLKPAALQDVMQAASKIYEAPLWIADGPGMKLLDIRAQARQMRLKHGVQIIFIDYISLIDAESHDLPRHEQISYISRSLKSLARELAIPIIALSQLTRDAEGKRPVLANIRESGSIEQDADVVLFLHRERDYLEDYHSSATREVQTELIVAKQRNGPVGTIRIAFLPAYAKFEKLFEDKLPDGESEKAYLLDPLK